MRAPHNALRLPHNKARTAAWLHMLAHTEIARSPLQALIRENVTRLARSGQLAGLTAALAIAPTQPGQSTGIVPEGMVSGPSGPWPPGPPA